MAPYPRKLTQAEFLRRNPGPNPGVRYQKYLYSYDRQKAARAKRTTGPGGGTVDLLAALLGMQGPMLPSIDYAGLQAQAQALAQSQIQPQIGLLQSEASQAAAASRAQIGQVQGLSEAAGRLAQGIAPSIQRTYQGAAESQAMMAKGFSDAMRELAQQDAASNSAFLTQQGAPQEQIDRVASVGEGGADAMYAASGYVPASTLGREGAAWTAYGQSMPAVLSRMGQQDAQALAAESSRQRAGISAQIAAAAGQIPGLAAQNFQDLQGQAYDRYQLARQAFDADRNFALQAYGAQLNAQALGMPSSATSNLFGYITDERGNPILDASGNPIPTYSTQQDIAAANAPPGPQRVNTTLSKANGYLTDNYGAPILGANGKPVPYKAAAAGKSGKVTGYKKDIVSTAGSLYKDKLAQVNDALKAAADSGGVDYTQAPGSAGGAFKPRAALSWKTAYNVIYQGLRAAHTGARGRWLYGVNDRTVRQWIEAYLLSKGIRKPPKKPTPGYQAPMVPWAS